MIFVGIYAKKQFNELVNNLENSNIESFTNSSYVSVNGDNNNNKDDNDESFNL